MPRYKLRTLLIGTAIGPPLLALAWFARFDPAVQAVAVVGGFAGVLMLANYMLLRGESNGP